MPEQKPSATTSALHIFLDEGLLHIVGGRLALSCDEMAEPRYFRLDDVRLVSIHGRAGITTPAIRALLRAGAPLIWRDEAGRMAGQVQGARADTDVRRAQYAARDDPSRRLAVARAFVTAKIASARGLLRRRAVAADTLARLADLGRAAVFAPDLSEFLMGLEGAAAAEVFKAWPALLGADVGFAFEGRSRRPSADPINAMLSYAYAMVAGEAMSAALAAGLDPYVGFLHTERPGRPSLALDLMEPLRAIVAERAVLRLINRHVIAPTEFSPDGEDMVRLSSMARKRLIEAVEARWAEPAPAAVFGPGRDWRSALHVEAGALASALRHSQSFACRLRLP